MNMNLHLGTMMKSKYKYLLCRLCLCKSGSLCDIYSCEEGQGYTAADCISDLLQFNVSKRDGYPQLVCLECLNKLYDFKKFKERCQNAKSRFEMDFHSDPKFLHSLKSEKKEDDQEMTLLEGNNCQIQSIQRHFNDNCLEQQEEEFSCSYYVKVEPDQELYEHEEEEEDQNVGQWDPINLASHHGVECNESPNENMNTDPYTKEPKKENDLLFEEENTQDGSKELNSFGGNNSHEQSVQKQSSDDQANQNMEGNQLTCEYYIKEEPDQALDSQEEDEQESERLDPLSMEPPLNDNGNISSSENIDADPYTKVFVKANHIPVKEENTWETVEQLAGKNVVKNMTDDSAVIPKSSSLLLCIPITKSYPKTSQCSGVQNKLYLQKNTVPSMPRSKEESGGNICEVCGKSFAQKYTLKMHMNTHMRIKPFQCKICKRDFAQSGTMKKHMSRSHMEKKYQCDLCPKTFAKEKCLASHFRIHRGHRPFQCSWCNHGFCSKEALDKHAAWHAGEVPFKCDYCRKEFDHKRKMSWHIRCCHMTKPHTCSICSSSFKTLSLLRNHMTLHTGERNYMCEVCGKTFRQKKNLKVHRRVHTGEKPYQCDICEKRYTQRNGLVAHLRKHHR